MIGIICAMKEEIEKINALMVDAGDVEANGLMFRRGEIGNEEVVTTVCGMGKVFAAIYAQAMIDEFLPDLVLSFGAAGTLVPELHIGDVVIMERAVQHDMDLSPLGYKRGEIPELSTVWFECEKRATDVLCECAEKLGIRYSRGNAATGDMFVATAEDKMRLRRNFDAHVAEMEGGAIAQVCAVHKVPFEIIRVITDEADGTAPQDFAEFLSKVTDDAAKMVKMLCNNYSI